MEKMCGLRTHWIYTHWHALSAHIVDTVYMAPNKVTDILNVRTITYNEEILSIPLTFSLVMKM